MVVHFEVSGDTSQSSCQAGRSRYLLAMGDANHFENLSSSDLDGIFYTKAALASLQETVADTMRSSWMFESLVVAALDVSLPPPAANSSNPNCGAHAFAALFPRVDSVLQRIFEDTEATGWMNRRSMEAALKNAGSSYRVLPRQLPHTGLALIEWTGRWPREGFWGSDLMHTHWVAFAEGFVYDINWSGWLPRHVWEDVVLNDVITALPKATGWQPHTGYELI